MRQELVRDDHAARGSVPFRADTAKLAAHGTTERCATTRTDIDFRMNHQLTLARASNPHTYIYV